MAVPTQCTSAGHAVAAPQRVKPAPAVRLRPRFPERHTAGRQAATDATSHAAGRTACAVAGAEGAATSAPQGMAGNITHTTQRRTRTPRQDDNAPVESAPCTRGVVLATVRAAGADKTNTKLLPKFQNLTTQRSSVSAFNGISFMAFVRARGLRSRSLLCAAGGTTVLAAARGVCAAPTQLWCAPHPTWIVSRVSVVLGRAGGCFARRLRA